MKLFHYTALLYLPSIIREGINRGEVPIPRDIRTLVDNAANLTTNPNDADQTRIWAEGRLDKTKIRITVDVDQSELVTFRQLRERYDLTAKWWKHVAPIEERKHWFYAFGGVQPAQFCSIKLRTDAAYKLLDDDALSNLISRITAERERALVLTPKPNSTLVDDFDLGFKPGVYESWLVDGDS